MSHFLLRATYFKKTNKQTNKKTQEMNTSFKLSPLKVHFPPKKQKSKNKKNPKPHRLGKSKES